MRHKLKWLMLARVLFTAILLTSTVLSQFRIEDPSQTGYLDILYWLTGFIFLLSIVYALLSPHVKRSKSFGYIQMGIDAWLVTLIVFITGGYFSFFIFLYLLVVIYACVILGLRGGITIAVVGTLFYGAMLFLQYSGTLPLFGLEESETLYHLSRLTIFYKALNTAVASIAVAVLCGLLIEQSRKSQKKIQEMEAYVQRVEKMAYMGEMAAGLAHEIRNPLASLAGSIQLLREDFSWNDDHQRLMQIVLRETARLNKLVNEFLFFARPPTGKPERFNLTDAVEEICGLFEKDLKFKKKKIALVRNLKQEIWVVMDRTHLHQVLWNLLLNAVEAVTEGGRIAIETHPQKSGTVRICVSDNGCGIAPEVQHVIFNPFFTTKSEGTGLGLSIVHRILENYHCRLDVESDLNQGATFSFVLKTARTAAVPNPGHTVPPGSAPLVFPTSLGRFPSRPQSV